MSQGLYCPYCGLTYPPAGVKVPSPDFKTRDDIRFDRYRERHAVHMKEGKLADGVAAAVLSVALAAGLYGYGILETLDERIFMRSGETGVDYVDLPLAVLAVAVGAATAYPSFRMIRARRSKRFWQG